MKSIGIKNLPLKIIAHRKITSVMRSILQVGCFVFFSASYVGPVRAEIVHHTIDHTANVFFGGPTVDFDGDGTNELSFQMYSVGFGFGSSTFLVAFCSEQTEALLKEESRLPLYAGVSVSGFPALGQWEAPNSFAIWNWTLDPTYCPDCVVLHGDDPPPTDPPPASTGDGVGMPGFGDYIGVRFLSGGNWYYGWIRFGTPASSLWWTFPTVVEFAYETRSNVAILTGAKPVILPAAAPEIIRPGHLRLRWLSETSKPYKVQYKESLAATGWTGLDFVVIGTTTNSAVDIPITGTTKFFRIIEAD